MCMEDPFQKKVHLLRDTEDGADGAYCGEMCFGMGESATYDRDRANCGPCLRMLDLEEMVSRLESPLDNIVRKIEERRSDV